MSPKEIASKLNVSVSSVNYYINMLRKKRRITRKKPVDLNLDNQIIELYTAGTKTREIAEIVFLSQDTVKSYITRLKKEGALPTQKPKRISSKDRVLYLYKKGLSRKEIAQKLRIADSSVRVFISKLIAEGKIEKPEVQYGDKASRQEKVVWLYNFGVSQSDISKLLKFSYATITRDVGELRKNRTIPKTQPKIEIDELAQKVRSDGFQRPEVILIANLYVYRKMYDRCKDFLSEYTKNAILTDDEIQGINSIMSKLEKIIENQADNAKIVVDFER